MMITEPIEQLVAADISFQVTNSMSLSANQLPFLWSVLFSALISLLQPEQKDAISHFVPATYDDTLLLRFQHGVDSYNQTDSLNAQLEIYKQTIENATSLMHGLPIIHDSFKVTAILKTTTSKVLSDSITFTKPDKTTTKTRTTTSVAALEEAMTTIHITETEKTHGRTATRKGKTDKATRNYAAITGAKNTMSAEVVTTAITDVDTTDSFNKTTDAVTYTTTTTKYTETNRSAGSRAGTSREAVQTGYEYTTTQAETMANSADIATTDAVITSGSAYVRQLNTTKNGTSDNYLKFTNDSSQYEGEVYSELKTPTIDAFNVSTESTSTSAMISGDTTLNVASLTNANTNTIREQSAKLQNMYTDDETAELDTATASIIKATDSIKGIESPKTTTGTSEFDEQSTTSTNNLASSTNITDDVTTLTMKVEIATQTTSAINEATRTMKALAADKENQPSATDAINQVIDEDQSSTIASKTTQRESATQTENFTNLELKTKYSSTAEQDSEIPKSNMSDIRTETQIDRSVDTSTNNMIDNIHITATELTKEIKSVQIIIAASEVDEQPNTTAANLASVMRIANEAKTVTTAIGSVEIKAHNATAINEATRPVKSTVADEDNQPAGKAEINTVIAAQHTNTDTSTSTQRESAIHTATDINSKLKTSYPSTAEAERVMSKANMATHHPGKQIHRNTAATTITMADSTGAIASTNNADLTGEFARVSDEKESITPTDGASQGTATADARSKPAYTTSPTSQTFTAALNLTDTSSTDVTKNHSTVTNSQVNITAAKEEQTSRAIISMTNLTSLLSARSDVNRIKAGAISDRENSTVLLATDIGAESSLSETESESKITSSNSKDMHVTTSLNWTARDDATESEANRKANISVRVSPKSALDGYEGVEFDAQHVGDERTNNENVIAITESALIMHLGKTITSLDGPQELPFADIQSMTPTTKPGQTVVIAKSSGDGEEKEEKTVAASYDKRAGGEVTAKEENVVTSRFASTMKAGSSTTKYTTSTHPTVLKAVYRATQSDSNGMARVNTTTTGKNKDGSDVDKLENLTTTDGQVTGEPKAGQAMNIVSGTINAGSAVWSSNLIWFTVAGLLAF